MLNPNICKRIKVQALEVQTTKYGNQTQAVLLLNGTVAGTTILEVNNLRHGFIVPGPSRYAYLKYSITSNSYYVTAKA